MVISPAFRHLPVPLTGVAPTPSPSNLGAVSTTMLIVYANLTLRAQVSSLGALNNVTLDDFKFVMFATRHVLENVFYLRKPLDIWYVALTSFAAVTSRRMRSLLPSTTFGLGDDVQGMSSRAGLPLSRESTPVPDVTQEFSVGVAVYAPLGSRKASGLKESIDLELISAVHTGTYLANMDIALYALHKRHPSVGLITTVKYVSTIVFPEEYGTVLVNVTGDSPYDPSDEEDYKNMWYGRSVHPGDVEKSPGVIVAMAFGSILVVVLFAYLIWKGYCSIGGSRYEHLDEQQQQQQQQRDRQTSQDPGGVGAGGVTQEPPRRSSGVAIANAVGASTINMINLGAKKKKQPLAAAVDKPAPQFSIIGEDDVPEYREEDEEEGGDMEEGKHVI